MCHVAIQWWEKKDPRSEAASPTLLSPQKSRRLRGRHGKSTGMSPCQRQLVTREEGSDFHARDMHQSTLL